MNKFKKEQKEFNEYLETVGRFPADRNTAALLSVWYKFGDRDFSYYPVQADKDIKAGNNNEGTETIRRGTVFDLIVTPDGYYYADDYDNPAAIASDQADNWHAVADLTDRQI